MEIVDPGPGDGFGVYETPGTLDGGALDRLARTAGGGHRGSPFGRS